MSFFADQENDGRKMSGYGGFPLCRGSKIGRIARSSESQMLVNYIEARDATVGKRLERSPDLVAAVMRFLIDGDCQFCFGSIDSVNLKDNA
jgi:hypothetical protein